VEQERGAEIGRLRTQVLELEETVRHLRLEVAPAQTARDIALRLAVHGPERRPADPVNPRVAIEGEELEQTARG
jgi:hypothetical protein